MVFSKSDLARVKARFERLAELLEKQAGENELLGGAKAKHISNLFTETGRVDIPAFDVHGTFTRDDVQRLVLMGRSRYKNLTIRFYDFAVEFPAEHRARVDVTAFLEAALASGSTVQEAHQLIFILEQPDEEWLFAEVQGVNMLEK
ncbi:MAG: hypothetical protein ACLFPD_08095 [Desulfosudaceae bacterium]